MSRDTTVIAFRQPDAIDDPSSELARRGPPNAGSGADRSRLLRRHMEGLEIAGWPASCVMPIGHIMRSRPGVGPIEVRRAKVRDRGEVGAEEKIRFTSSILPKWARRTKSLDALLPVLYLRGVLTGDFREVLTRGRRRRARLLEGDRRGLPKHQAPALLGSQDRQRA
jgi:putative transposase